MRNKSAAGFYSSSLEMLLDTMCNMLGGVVFIALMVAVVARDSTTHRPSQFRGQAVQLSNDLATITASNNLVEAEMHALLLRLQDPHQRPQTNVMRLPDLGHTGKQPWLVILQRGKVYPLDVFSSGTPPAPILNDKDVLYQRQTGYIETRAEAGRNPEDAVTDMVQAFKDNHETNYYFAFWVYADSFDAFVRARDTVTKLGFQYGWNPLPSYQRLKAGRQGERVQPQN
jgi:hypothetical protein